MDIFQKIIQDLTVQAGDIVYKLIMSLVVLIITKILLKIIYKVIDNVFNGNNSKRFNKLNEEKRRIETLNSISKSVSKYVMYFISILTILSFFMEITQILAVAGIGGLAVGFGAQGLVEDVVTGFFIFFEDQFAVGEYITIDGLSGIVESMGLRTTQLRDFTGDLHIVHNGKIDKVTNHSRGNIRALVDIGVAYEENISRVLKVLENLCNEISESNPEIIEGPDVLGVTKLDSSSVVIRIIAKTIPMQQWHIERVLRHRIKETFDKEGIEIPYEKRVVINNNKS